MMSKKGQNCPESMSCVIKMQTFEKVSFITFLKGENMCMIYNVILTY